MGCGGSCVVRVIERDTVGIRAVVPSACLREMTATAAAVAMMTSAAMRKLSSIEDSVGLGGHCCSHCHTIAVVDAKSLL